MAGYLSWCRWALGAGGIAGVLLAVPVKAQALVDPTRSPQATAPVDNGPNIPTQGGLTVVVTAKEGVLALYNGETLRIGSVIKDAKVVRITPSAVFTRSAQGKVERLPLYPEVDIQQARGTGQTKDGGIVRDAPSKSRGNKQ